jgi:anti-sigma regulatory factor (Ser/Thr protein kinase)
MPTEAVAGATLQFSADPRLAAAAGGVARYFADAAGMESDAVAKLQAATLAACELAYAHDPHTETLVSVEVTRFTDRIEVTVAHPGNAPDHLPALSGVDRIDNVTRGGNAVTRLTKFIPQS